MATNNPEVAVHIKATVDNLQQAIAQMRKMFDVLRTDGGNAPKPAEEGIERLKGRAKRLYDETRTAAERYQIELREINAMHKAGAIDTDTYTRSLAQAKSRMEGVGMESARANMQTGLLGGAMRNLGGLMAGYFGVQGAVSLVRLGDQMTSVQARLKLVTADQVEFNKAYASLGAIANQTRQPIADTVNLYTKLAPALKGMNLEMQDGLDITKSVGLSLQITGADGAAAAAGIQQFAQAMGSGVLRGDEFNSIMENSPRLAKAMADGLGVPQTALRSLAENGELTAERVITALRSQTRVLEAEAAKMPVTVGQAVTVAKNQFSTWFAKTNEAIGITAGLASAIAFATNNATTLATVVSMVATVMAARFVGALVAAQGGLMGLTLRMMAATQAMYAGATAATVAGRAMALMGGPIGIAISLLGALALTWFTTANASESASARMKKAADDAAAAIDKANKAGKVATNDQLTTNGSALKSQLGQINEARAALVKLESTGTVRTGRGTASRGSPQFEAAKERMIADIAQKTAQYKTAAAAHNEAYGRWKKEQDDQAALEASTKATMRGLAENGGKAPKMPKVPTGGASATDENARFNAFDAEIEAQKRAHDVMEAQNGTFKQFSIAQEVKYWDEVRNMAGLTANEKAKAEEKYVAAANRAHKDADADAKKAKAELAASATAADKAVLDSTKATLGERLTATRAIFEQLKTIYGADSEEAKRAGRDVLNAEKEVYQREKELRLQSAQDAKDAALAEVAANEEAARQQLANGEISYGEMVGRLREYLNQRLMAVQTYNAQVRTEAKNDPYLTPEAKQDAVAGANKADANAKGDKVKDGKQLDKDEDKAIEDAFNKDYKPMIDGMNDAWGNALTGMLTRGQSFRQAMAGIWKQMSALYLQEQIIKPLQASAFKYARELIMEKVFGVQKNTIQQTASTTSLGISAGESIAKVTNNATTAGTGAMSALSSIPIVGPALGIAMMAVMIGLALKQKSSIKSAAGGYDIPAGLNPMTQLHEQEMVLPKQHANTIRRLGEMGGQAQQQPQAAPVNIVINASAIDGKGMRQVLQDNAKHMVDVLKGENRNFAFGV